MDPNEYLADSFDVSKLTVPNLRSILVEHQVYFPSSATKGQLIEIFNNTIKPKSSSILKKYNVEPINISDIDKTIPSKRQSDNNSSNLKKSKRKIRKNTTSSPDSSLNSNSNSFLKIEKFEINEQDDIFNGPIDGTPIKLLKKTKYSKKIDSKDILSKFDTSLPSSNNFKSNSKSPSNIDIINNNIVNNDNNNNDENNDNDNANDNDNNNTTYNNIFDHQKNEITFIEEVTNKTLLGPTKNIKDSIIIATSDNEFNEQENNNDDNDDIEEIELLKDNVQEKLVSKIDVKSLSSFESDEISFSQDSIDSDNINSSVEEVENFIEKSNDKSLNELAESLIKIEPADSIQEGHIIHEIQIEKSTENAITEESSDIIHPKGKSTNLSSFFFFISKIIFIAFGILNIILPLIVIFSVREIQKNVGYCGFESPPKLLDIWHKIPEPLSNKLLPIQPYIENFESFMIDLTPVECKKCPSNGKCTLNTLTCDFNYIKKTPLSSFFGLIPLEEYCEYDFLHEEKMRYLFDYTLSYLHRHNENPLTVDELHDYLKSTRPSNIRSDEFEEYWNNFVKSEIEDNNNSIFTINHNTNEITLSHLTPTEYYTKTFDNVERNKKSKNLFKKTPPTVDLKNYYTAKQ